MAAPDHARRAALGLILGVLEDRLTLAEQINTDALDGLSPAERARAQRLAASTLRNLERADRMLKSFLRKRPTPDIHVLLRMATVELCEDDAPAHGVVNAAVTLVRSAGKKTESFAGLVNAVLRKVSEDRARWQTLPVPELPGWLRGRLMSAYGKAAVQKMEIAHHDGAPIDFSCKSDADDWAARLGAELLPTGSLRMKTRVQVTDLEGYEAGEWWVQDAAAALAAKALNPQPGERILDLCAAPGGKTLQLAAAGAQVTALDISEGRMARVQENLARTGLAAETVVADALHWDPEAPFDAILMDAPCSATGTIRRHPDLPFVKDAQGIKPLFALQAALLERALGWLKPGGRLVYCTCSLLPEEGEAQIRMALGHHPDLTIAPINAAGIEDHWRTPEGGLRLRPDYWPERGGMDGFYIARIDR
ncbi:transcription antitermination factor NusB [Thioclava sp. A2]|uniref:RsmB/NOP family class I SAM-dependent RNA methyltransferase n=1 Tax=Thioclava sp. FCG-A2 TaxID=3080562 RepID=UPI0029549FC5|nr:transcription antitermination factor NusB [Thioclava sp. A2]MDV7272045.1 transcription antitermination factor NusB [Thioclava sp. A2]